MIVAVTIRGCEEQHSEVCGLLDFVVPASPTGDTPYYRLVSDFHRVHPKDEVGPPSLWTYAGFLDLGQTNNDDAPNIIKRKLKNYRPSFQHCTVTVIHLLDDQRWVSDYTD